MKVFSRFLKRIVITICLWSAFGGAVAQITSKRRVIAQPASAVKLENSSIRRLYPSVRSQVIALAGVTALPAKAIYTKGWNGYTSSSTVYPLKISAVDTLFFNNLADMNYVKTAFTTAAITSITKVYVSPPSTYAGRDYDYYYFCNAVNTGYFSVNGLTTKPNTAFTVSYNSGNKLYTVVRNYNGQASSEAISTMSLLATNLANNLTGFTGTEFLDKSLTNLGNFFFFLNRPAVSTPPPPPPAPSPPVIAPLTVKNNTLLDHSGKPAILKGVNVPVYGTGFTNDADAVAAAVKNNTKANCVRISWESQLAIPVVYPSSKPPYYTNANLDYILSKYQSEKILPVLMLHDLTDMYDNSVAGFNKYVVGFWTDPNILAILKKYQNNLVLNLQNEWGATWDGMTGPTFVSTYSGLISKLRAAGITAPIMIDAPDGGANSAFLIANGAALIAADPLKNIILSVHTYWSQENGAIVNCPMDYVTKIKAMASSGLPFVLGEVSDWCVRGADGQDFESTSPVNFLCPGTASVNKYAEDYDAILTEACNDGIGFIAWSRYQDGLYVRNIYDQNTGTSINTKANAGSWPADMLSSSKIYGLNNPSITDPFF